MDAFSMLIMPVLADLQAPIASIGGAGVFDGIFVTGIVAVLIASPPPRRQVSDQ